MNLKNIFPSIVCLIIIYAGISPDKILFSRPVGDHAWAQIDRASLALNYYQHQAEFLYPRSHNIAFNNSAISLGEFPLIPYTVSKLYHIFGFHEWIYRLVTFLLSVSGFIIAFFISGGYLKSFQARLIASTAWLLSPNLIYFSTGFMPDNAALSMFILGFYFFIKNNNSFSLKSIIPFVICSSIAVLLKSSTLFLYIAAVMAWCIMTFQRVRKFNFTVLLLLLITPVLFCAIWIIFANSINARYSSSVFKLGLLLPHDIYTFKNSLVTLILNLPKHYSPLMLIVFIAGLIYWFKNFNSKSFIHLFTLLGLLGWVSFTFIMMRNAVNHGYYHVPFYFLLFTFSVIVIELLINSERFNNIPNQIIITLIGIFLLLNLLYNYYTVRKMAFNYELINKDWYSAENILTANNINSNEIIFSANDRSYNISLYLMNRKGWTCMPKHWDTYKLDALKNCDYAVLDDTSYIHTTSVAHFFSNKIASYNSLHIYKLKNH